MIIRWDFSVSVSNFRTRSFTISCKNDFFFETSIPHKKKGTYWKNGAKKEQVNRHVSTLLHFNRGQTGLDRVVNELSVRQRALAEGRRRDERTARNSIEKKQMPSQSGERRDIEYRDNVDQEANISQEVQQAALVDQKERKHVEQDDESRGPRPSPLHVIERPANVSRDGKGLLDHVDLETKVVTEEGVKRRGRRGAEQTE